VRKPPKRFFRQDRRSRDRPSHRARPHDHDHDRGDPNDVHYVATHEAGHAVAAVVLGLNLRSIDLKRRHLPDGQVSQGFTDCPVAVEDVRNLDAVIPCLVQALAGPYAESLVNPRVLQEGGARGDLDEARKVAVLAVCEATDTGGGRMTITPEEQKRNEGRIHSLLMEANQRAMQLIDDHRHAIATVAGVLAARMELSGEEVKSIVEAAAQVERGGM
jgi:ATP-dependent Zn protease